MKNKIYITDEKYDLCRNWTQHLGVKCERSYHLGISYVLGET